MKLQDLQKLLKIKERLLIIQKKLSKLTLLTTKD